MVGWLLADQENKTTSGRSFSTRWTKRQETTKKASIVGDQDGRETAGETEIHSLNLEEKKKKKVKKKRICCRLAAARVARRSLGPVCGQWG